MDEVAVVGYVAGCQISAVDLDTRGRNCPRDFPTATSRSSGPSGSIPREGCHGDPLPFSAYIDGAVVLGLEEAAGQQEQQAHG